tara:strand:- start:42 stop:911 length:870 start_codon:yes stop_codon:yes gene_type:complete
VLSRIDTARLATYNPGFDTKPHSIDYRSKGTLENLPLGYDSQSDAQDIHHVLGLQEHVRQLVENLSPEGQIQVLNRLISHGIPVPQDPRNLIAVNKKGHNKIHGTQKDMGLESNNELAKKQLQNQIAQLPLEQRLIAVDTFAEHMYPAIVENLHSLGYKVPTQAENVRAYNQAIAQEANSEKKLHLLEQMKEMYGEKPTMENIRKVMESDKDLYEVGRIRTQDVDATNMKRFAADNELARAIMASMRTESPGDNRERALVIDSGGGDVTFGEGVLRNGKNGNGHINGAA